MKNYMTNLKQLDKNVETFDKIINNLIDFSEIAVELKKTHESLVAWTQEIKTIKAALRDQGVEIERWIKNAFNRKNNILIVLMIINLILNGIIFVYLLSGK